MTTMVDQQQLERIRAEAKERFSALRNRKTIEAEKSKSIEASVEIELTTSEIAFELTTLEMENESETSEVQIVSTTSETGSKSTASEIEVSKKTVTSKMELSISEFQQKVFVAEETGEENSGMQEIILAEEIGIKV